MVEPKNTLQEPELIDTFSLICMETYYGFNLRLELRALELGEPEKYADLRGFFVNIQKERIKRKRTREILEAAEKDDLSRGGIQA